MNLDSKTIRLRLIEEKDASFVLSLRLDSAYNQFLSAVTPDVDALLLWIKNYKIDEAAGTRFIFIKNPTPPAKRVTLKIIKPYSSARRAVNFLYNENKTRYSALESAFLVYKFAFDILKFKKSHFDVRKGNDKVISFHEKMGAIKTGENELDYFFEITKSAVLDQRERLRNKLN